MKILNYALLVGTFVIATALYAFEMEFYNPQLIEVVHDSELQKGIKLFELLKEIELYYTTLSAESAHRVPEIRAINERFINAQELTKESVLELCYAHYDLFDAQQRDVVLLFEALIDFCRKSDFEEDHALIASALVRFNLLKPSSIYAHILRNSDIGIKDFFGVIIEELEFVKNKKDVSASILVESDALLTVLINHLPYADIQEVFNYVAQKLTYYGTRSIFIKEDNRNTHYLDILNVLKGRMDGELDTSAIAGKYQISLSHITGHNHLGTNLSGIHLWPTGKRDLVLTALTNNGTREEPYVLSRPDTKLLEVGYNRAVRLGMIKKIGMTEQATTQKYSTFFPEYFNYKVDGEYTRLFDCLESCITAPIARSPDNLYLIGCYEYKNNKGADKKLYIVLSLNTEFIPKVCTTYPLISWDEFPVLYTPEKKELRLIDEQHAPRIEQIKQCIRSFINKQRIATTHGGLYLLPNMGELIYMLLHDCAPETTGIDEYIQYIKDHVPDLKLLASSYQETKDPSRILAEHARLYDQIKCLFPEWTDHKIAIHMLFIMNALIECLPIRHYRVSDESIVCELSTQLVTTDRITDILSHKKYSYLAQLGESVICLPITL